MLGLNKIPYRANFYLKRIFGKNGYPENVIDECFKIFLDNIHLAKENVSTVGKKGLPLAYLFGSNIFAN